MRILVTGGAGYIGSHATKRLLEQGHDVLVVDSLFRGHMQAIQALQSLPGIGEHLAFHETDVSNKSVMAALMTAYGVDTIMHFAALAYVGESVDDPIRYYRNNTAAVLSLLEAAAASNVQRFIFSSTCATYGEPDAQYIPIKETTPQAPINPYGASKLFVERILADHAEAQQRAGKPFAHACLRYFNVAGDDPDGVVGESHQPETHLIPIVLEAALGIREHVTIFGTDYDTPDGTCIRDYVHVVDLVDAHIAVMNALQAGDRRIYNIGVGQGYSVREIIEACKRVTGIEFAVKEGSRRAGDPPKLFADPSKIQSELGWAAKYTNLDEIIQTAWDWHQAHPRGWE
ncbi:MAG: UDP-glucose 4-epimerase GalE [Planctomycetota bacterium]